MVKQLNEQLREQAIADSKKRVGYLEQELAKTTLQDMRAVLYNLLESEKQKGMLANVNEDFALKVIDPAVAPKSGKNQTAKGLLPLGEYWSISLVFCSFLLLSFLKRLKNSNKEKNQL